MLPIPHIAIGGVSCHDDLWLAIRNLHNVNLRIVRPPSRLWSQQPDGWPRASKIVVANFCRHSCHNLHISPHLDVTGLSCGPHAIGLQPGRGDAAISVPLRLDGHLSCAGILCDRGVGVPLLLIVPIASWGLVLGLKCTNMFGCIADTWLAVRQEVISEYSPRRSCPWPVSCVDT